jgi:hypothetical protein
VHTCTDADLIERLSALAASLRTQRDECTAPAFTLSAVFRPGFSASIPFDAATIPGSPILRLLVRDASKPGRPPLRSIPSAAGRDEEGELWTAVSTPQFAAALLRDTTTQTARIAVESGDSDRGGRAAAAAAELMTSEMQRVLSPYFSSHHTSEAGGDAPPSLLSSSSVPIPLAAAAKRWGAGFPNGTLGLEEPCVSLEPWRLAICGDFIARQGSASSPAEASAMGGMEAAERVARWFEAPSGSGDDGDVEGDPSHPDRRS